MMSLEGSSQSLGQVWDPAAHLAFHRFASYSRLVSPSSSLSASLGPTPSLGWTRPRRVRCWRLPTSAPAGISGSDHPSAASGSGSTCAAAGSVVVARTTARIGRAPILRDPFRVRTSLLRPGTAFMCAALSSHNTDDHLFQGENVAFTGRRFHSSPSLSPRRRRPSSLHHLQRAEEYLKGARVSLRTPDRVRRVPYAYCH